MRVSWTTVVMVFIVVAILNLWFWGEAVPDYIHYVMRH